MKVPGFRGSEFGLKNLGFCTTGGGGGTSSGFISTGSGFTHSVGVLGLIMISDFEIKFSKLKYRISSFFAGSIISFLRGLILSAIRVKLKLFFGVELISCLAGDQISLNMPFLTGGTTKTGFLFRTTSSGSKDRTTGGMGGVLMLIGLGANRGRPRICASFEGTIELGPGIPCTYGIILPPCMICDA